MSLYMFVLMCDAMIAAAYIGETCTTVYATLMVIGVLIRYKF